MLQESRALERCGCAPGPGHELAVPAGQREGGSHRRIGEGRFLSRSSKCRESGEEKEATGCQTQSRGCPPHPPVSPILSLSGGQGDPAADPGLRPQAWSSAHTVMMVRALLNSSLTGAARSLVKTTRPGKLPRPVASLQGLQAGWTEWGERGRERAASQPGFRLAFSVPQRYSWGQQARQREASSLP